MSATDDLVITNLIAQGAKPNEPTVRLLRAIYGLCPDHDDCSPDDHPDSL